jgi:hypothetical protein
MTGLPLNCLPHPPFIVMVLLLAAPLVVLGGFAAARVGLALLWFRRE